jgi:hypothetical protein
LVRDAVRSEWVSSLISLIYRESTGNSQFFARIPTSRQLLSPQKSAISGRISLHAEQGIPSDRTGIAQAVNREAAKVYERNGMVP